VVQLLLENPVNLVHLVVLLLQVIPDFLVYLVVQLHQEILVDLVVRQDL